MVRMVHSTARLGQDIPKNCNGSDSSAYNVNAGSSYLPHGGQLKTLLFDVTEADFVILSFLVDARTLSIVQICDWTETGLSGDPELRIWPVAEVKRLDDGTGRGIVKWRKGA